MSDSEKPSEKTIGAIEWRDLSVNDANQVSDFYASVVGWEKQPVSMGDYDDFNMNLASSGETIAGVCHCLLYTSPSPRDLSTSRMPSSA